MELFALNEEVAALESALPRLEGVALLAVLIPLAWQLRQRDHKRALQLAGEAEALLRGESVEDLKRRHGMARLRLVRGECRWLLADLDAARNDANAAIATFEGLGDRIGAGDGKWLLASVWGDRGSVQRRDEWLELAIADYRAGDDRIRIDTATARGLLYAAFRDSNTTAIRLAQQFDPAIETGPSVTTWAASARAITAGPAGEIGVAIRCFLQAYQAALACGQIRQAILAATNAADDFSILGELDSALEWDERALTLARNAGWPGMIGNALAQIGNVQRLLGRHDAAGTALREALAVRAALKESNGYAITLAYLGEVSIDVGDPAAALDYFREVEARARPLGGTNLLCRALRGQANALCRLDQPDAARAKVEAALALAMREGNRDEQIDTLRVYAELYLRYPFTPPAGMTAASAALHCLNRALAVAATIEGYNLPGELLDEIANAHAASGDYALAFSHAKEAAKARDSTRLDQARNRAIAMQARQETERVLAESERRRQLAETERVRAEAEYHRRLAATEAGRAAALEDARATLEALGLIGREITASLNADAVFSTLYRHVNSLLDGMSFNVFLLDPGGEILNEVFSVEAGVPSPLIRIRVDDPASYTARCVRERQEVVINEAPGSQCANLVPGTLDTRSLLLAPLMIGQRMLGAMSIQTTQLNVYGERERAVFRTLCAYGAIALDNAAAYALAERARQQANHALEEARHTEAMRTKAEAARASLESQLRESQKMQAIGTLAGGIAHDFNNILATILGNVELAREDVSTNPLALQSLDEIHKASARARDLVQQILSFGRRQPTERKRILLCPVIQESVRLLRATVPARIGLEVHCEPDVPAVLADATQIQQILINMVTNAMQAMRTGSGRIRIRLDTLLPDATSIGAHHALRSLHAKHPGRIVRLTVRDDGPGMDATTLARIFEPFFTTKPVDEGTGLGLSVVHGIVQTHDGAIEADSQPGKGSTFTIYLPAADADTGLPVPARDAVANLATPETGGGQHILYLDDDESLVFLVTRLLERRGYRISGHTDQREALAALRAGPDAFDLVVTDYNMPGMSGLDVARAVRIIRADLPVAIASGFIDETLQNQAEGAGVRELIFKANAVEDLCEAFARLARTVG